MREIATDVLPELDAFANAVRARDPRAGSWCEAWTVRDIVIHQAGNAEELARVLSAHLSGRPVPTRRFEERETPYRAMGDLELWSAFLDRCTELAEVCAEAESTAEQDTEIEWTGRTVTVPFFAEHMREELILHRWDVTGDDSTAQQALSEPWMTRHSVLQVGRPLLARGAAHLPLDDRHVIRGRLRVSGTDDIVVTAGAESTDIGFASQEGAATIESDAATRALLLWGRRPANPNRWHSDAEPEELRSLRLLLSGY
ncbi:maleylpyruvate isomerase N-terminal domain-containing protein [Nocardia alni]|uniref:maleylpyruvate isomerase N-terminal domain-containing protein n=1 Tax=Nocardia alni TaxID=2815723 RepID=UPI001C23FB34|nr:maleylpyruvate isomerase N-terminal domain-containing protein [Nocardia alni]